MALAREMNIGIEIRGGKYQGRGKIYTLRYCLMLKKSVARKIS
jgi:hypothetical protein